jgi:hypothetical protein
LASRERKRPESVAHAGRLRSRLAIVLAANNQGGLEESSPP